MFSILRILTKINNLSFEFEQKLTKIYFKMCINLSASKKLYINENKFKLYSVLFEIIVVSIDNPAIKIFNSCRKPEVS